MKLSTISRADIASRGERPWRFRDPDTGRARTLSVDETLTDEWLTRLNATAFRIISVCAGHSEEENLAQYGGRFVRGFSPHFYFVVPSGSPKICSMIADCLRGPGTVVEVGGRYSDGGTVVRVMSTIDSNRAKLGAKSRWWEKVLVRFERSYVLFKSFNK